MKLIKKIFHGDNLLRIQKKTTVVKKKDDSVYADEGNFLISIGRGKEAKAFQLSFKEAALISTILDQEVQRSSGALQIAYKKARKTRNKRNKERLDKKAKDSSEFEGDNRVSVVKG